MTDEQRFDPSNIRAFAEAWYAALDLHLPFSQAEAFLAPEGLQMIFPEKTLHGMGDFAAWYGGGTYQDGEKAPGVINLFFDEAHRVLEVASERNADGVEVDIVVGWQASWFVAPEPHPRRTSMNAHQRWQVIAAPAGRNPYGLVIVAYNAMAKPFEYAPGFARL
jgi:hypothetical protein